MQTHRWAEKNKPTHDYPKVLEPRISFWENKFPDGNYLSAVLVIPSRKKVPDNQGLTMIVEIW